MGTLNGKKAFVTGIANDKSLAAGIALALYMQGAEVVCAVQNEKTLGYARPVLTRIGDYAPYIMDAEAEPLAPTGIEAVLDEVGPVDILVHSMAFMPATDLHGPVSELSAAGLTRAMNISVLSLNRMVCAANLKPGASVLTLTYEGARKAINNYNAMGIVKAALEADVRYLAAELGPRNISVNAISPGPVDTRAGSGISNFAGMMAEAAGKAPLGRLATPTDVGALAAFLASDAGHFITGQVVNIDGGLSIL